MGLVRELGRIFRVEARRTSRLKHTLENQKHMNWTRRLPLWKLQRQLKRATIQPSTNSSRQMTPEIKEMSRLDLQAFTVSYIQCQ
jgi:hypothetical protein